MKQKGSQSLKALRRGNKEAVLLLFMGGEELSRVRIAAATGLTTASVTQLVRELIDEGLLEERGEIISGAAGRRETLLRFAGERVAAVGVNVESDRTHVSLCTWNDVLEEEIYPTASFFENGTAALAERVGELASKCGGRRFVGTGLAVAGFVDEEKGVTVGGYGLFPDAFPLAEKIAESTGTDTLLVNNVRAQARALMAKSDDSFLLVKHGPGVGCAAISDGAPVYGADGKAGEIGHTIAEENGLPCRCGKRGCLETCVSEQRITALYEEKTRNKLAVREIYALYGKDGVATEVLDACLNKLAVAIGNTATLLNPRRVLVTGGVFSREDTYGTFCRAVEKAGFGGQFSLTRIGDEKKVKAFSGARHVMLKKLFGI